MRTWTLLAFAYLALLPPSAAQDTDRLYLTWQRDPTTTMTVMCLQEAQPLPIVPGGTTALPPHDLPFVDTVTIDGDPSDWWDRGLVLDFLPNQDQRLPPADNLQPRIRLGWNADGVVVAARVTDDQAQEGADPDSLWWGDALELFVGDAVGSRHFYQVIVASGADPAFGTTRQKIYQRGSGPGVAAEPVVKAASSVDGTTAIYEVLLPWSNLPQVQTTAGTVIGLQLYLNDRDGATRRSYIWHPIQDTHTNPGSMQPLRLSDSQGGQVSARAMIRELDGATVVDLAALPTFADATARLLVAGGEIARAPLEAVHGTARAIVPLPEPPTGQTWGIINIQIGDQLIAAVAAPQRHEPPTPLALRWWNADAGEATATTVTTTVRPVHQWPGKNLHQVELTGLSPATIYRFRMGDGTERGFRTLAADLREPLRLMVGGDMRHQQNWMEQMNRVAMRYQPHAVIWGGDLAYDNGSPNAVGLIQEWFDAVHNTMTTADGLLIPMIVTIGNHEVQHGYYFNHKDYEQTDAWRARIAPFYYQLFPFPGQPGYGALDIGRSLSLILLDSDHSNPVPGVQTEWLAQALADRQDVTHIIPVYHVPSHPSVRSFEDRTAVAVRQFWLPLFEQHGIRLAFENHDHAYKRTAPIRGGEIHPNGIVFIGDGAWGVEPRPVHDAATTWYLEKSVSVRHGVLLTLHGNELHTLAINEDGEIIDEYPGTGLVKPVE